MSRRSGPFERIDDKCALRVRRSATRRGRSFLPSRRGTGASTSTPNDRKRKKRDYRRLWITRISAAVRSEGMSYSVFMNGLKRAGIVMNRKMLSELAIHDMEAFRSLVGQAKSALR